MTQTPLPPAAPSPFQLGIYSFGERTADAATGLTVSPQQRVRDLLEEIELADQVGLDVYGVGEHHRPDFVISNPAMVLAAAASRTRNIRLTSAVTVLGTEDPVRVYQAFSTLDLISGGRAEIMAGRGSFIESFPLFIGGHPQDYDELFSEKLDLLLKLQESEHLSWKGRYRAPLNDVGVYPRPVQPSIPVWLGVGGTPASAQRAGEMGLPMALAIIGGMPERFQPFVRVYRDAARAAGHDPALLPLGINSHGYLARTSQQAADEAYPAHAAVMNKLGRERGWPPLTRAHFEGDRSLRGASFVGDPQQVSEKILFQHELFGHQRFLLQTSVGTLPHAQIMKSIELLGTEVAPVVRAEVARRTAPATAPVGVG
ncbi:LLM class flavin-dependent oxidoreductase (plasmid) [Deinococcus sp. KNUC1210]|uniref:LLM class flavin-dependent oxidoreductase n=1 Tax=Deinococcus sp. KNUC1210 TaxID=2917691 RepID=UPI001EEFCB75|nr:LLM class flavin-dependent oxidoreductase [Deinococcus sp. KNUC1210]ULH17306.1 LLM class flavin-dependent oxidoreductase [Deinococcus sp. KNUC1210]